MSRPLDGKLALVTGASRGIGAATAEHLAGLGAHVIMVARSAEAMEAVEERIHAAGGSATLAPMDLLEDGAIGRLAQAISERWDALDILVLNAATLGSLTPVQFIDAKEYGRSISLNLLANQALIAGFDPMLRKADRADVFGVTSSVGATPRAYWGAYGSTKAALDTLLGAYADENEQLGKIRVHIVDPGATRTKMRERAFPGENPDDLKGPEVVAEAIGKRIQSDEAGRLTVDA
ncbi:SDR family NAD(P)-dependent oxidoreductase [Sphingomicrobium clamense]|uniref:SDR family NAD(P)-dependent oxidoreductase n=1 Tax=Sphingomicrobium clamense TaxID=2851013 RepID=A0ABS6V8N8_9SPHN|nr:SDR family NAD(P)-dependent oxidoreductase [Sphingomicrobium sp. B8]MBW0145522.1 SDR family NAD(P)-dependent oxidoreductase [Sphingomicrobium sp. B8]